MKPLAEKVKEIRFEKGMTLVEFAKLFGGKTGSGTISNWENGRNKPNGKRLEQLAQLGDTTVEELLEYEKTYVKSIGKKIQQLRFSKGLTMEEFGKLVGGVGKSNVNRWEKGNNLPNKKRLKKIAKMNNQSVEEFLDEAPFVLSKEEKEVIYAMRRGDEVVIKERMSIHDKIAEACKSHGFDYTEMTYALSVLRYIELNKTSDAKFYKELIKNDTPALWQVAHGLRKEELDGGDDIWTG